MWLLREISLPHFSRYRLRTVLTILGIALGVASIVATSMVTDAVFRGFRRTVEATAGNADLTLTNGGVGVPEDAVTDVLAVEGVAAATPLVEGFAPLARDADSVLAVFGLDLLGDEEHEVQLPRTAVHIPDELAFVSQAGSVALPKTFAEARGYSIGSTFEVVTPQGVREVTVRGLIDPVGPATLFGSMVALMDLPAAQRLLAKEGKVDRIDIRVDDGISVGDVQRRLTQRLAGVGRVEETAVHGAKAESLLYVLRVILGIFGLVAATVGVFLIYHTVAVSVSQRRREIATLNALGVSRRTVLAWLLTEALLMGVVACMVGILVGVVLAHLAAAIFGPVASAWIILRPEPPALTAITVLLAGLTGIATSLVATAVPAWSTVWTPLDRALRGERRAMPTSRAVKRALGFCVGGLALCAVMLAAAPRTLEYAPLVAYIFTTNSLVLMSIALLAPAAAAAVGWLAGRAAARGRGLALLLASGATLRNPAAPAAVIAAVVVGLGWNLANASVISSFQTSFLGWLDEYYRSDVVVSGGGGIASLLTLPPIEEATLEELRRIPGVAAVQGIRMAEGSYDGRPVVLQGLDRADAPMPVIDATWEEVEGDLWAGRGVLVSDSVANKSGIEVGDSLSLPSPSGAQSLRVLGIVADFGGGDLGSIAIDRKLYSSVWRDTVVNRIRVWVDAGADAASVRAAIQRGVGTRRGLTAVTAEEFRAAARELYVENAFAINYAVIMIAAAISFVAVANFFLTASLDRAPQLDVLRAVGVAPGQLRAALLAEGALLGLAGALLGLVAGAVASRIIVLHSTPMVTGWHLRYVFPVGPAVGAAIGALLLAALAGYLPRTRRSTSGRAILE